MSLCISEELSTPQESIQQHVFGTVPANKMIITRLLTHYTASQLD